MIVKGRKGTPVQIEQIGTLAVDSAIKGHSALAICRTYFTCATAAILAQFVGHVAAGYVTSLRKIVRERFAHPDLRILQGTNNEMRQNRPVPSGCGQKARLLRYSTPPIFPIWAASSALHTRFLARNASREISPTDC